ncbi:unnamed protein product [Urochloa decumbens]|uniref:Uncharacterized protein n=1 Tax=Urochloa decumbens TaxID=240449 RepID=A0ABC9GDX9_9POAL
MAMRSLVGKLKAFTVLMPRSSGGLPKDLQWSQRSRKLIDPTKFGSVQEQARAIPARIDEQMKRDWDELQRRLKAYDRVTFATAGAGLGVTLYVASCFIDALLEED